MAPATVDRPRHGASNAAPETDGHEWFTMDLADVLDALGTATGGLGDAEAALRLQQYGPNTLPRREPPGLFEIVLRQFKSPLIYLLGIAAGVSLVIGEIKDAAFIMGVLLINAVIGTVQENKAESAIAALAKRVRTDVDVIRGGVQQRLPSEQLVPGDLVRLEAGAQVPADLRLISARNLHADESALTGESAPVGKSVPRMPVETVLAERTSMLWAAS